MQILIILNFHEIINYLRIYYKINYSEKALTIFFYIQSDFCTIYTFKRQQKDDNDVLHSF